MIHKEDVFLIGKLTKAHGLKGEINFQFTNDIWERADCDYLICEVDGILVPFSSKNTVSAAIPQLWSSLKI